jgi:hypothetical protein
MLDRESFTARRVGPLDVNMLDEQREHLTALRDILGADSPSAAKDALDGLIHLAAHLKDQFEYAEQEQSLPRRHRQLIHAGRAADELRGLAELSDEGDDDFRDIQDMLDAFDAIQSGLQSDFEDEQKRRRDLGPVRVTIDVRRGWLDEFRAATAEDGSNDDEHDLLVEVADEIATAVNRAADPLGPPPEDLADAWERYQHGGEVAGWELSKLDEWRDDRAREEGF